MLLYYINNIKVSEYVPIIFEKHTYFKGRIKF